MWADDMDIYDWWSGPRELSLQVDPGSLRLYWITEDGKQVFIEDMVTSHIVSICRANIEGRMNCDEQTVNRFLLELSIRRRLQSFAEPTNIKDLPF